MRMRVVHRRTVEPYHAVLHCNGIAAHSNHALDEILGAIGRKDEHDDVAAMDGLEMENILAQRHAGNRETED